MLKQRRTCDGSARLRDSSYYRSGRGPLPAWRSTAGLRSFDGGGLPSLDTVTQVT